MEIGIKKEVKVMEGRVALIPKDVESLIEQGHSVKVEKDAGLKSGFSDENYIAAGAVITNTRGVWGCDLLVAVKEPIENEFKWFRNDLVIFSYLHLAACPHLVNALVNAGTTAIALENVEMNGRLPGLDPMSAVAGRLAGQLAVNALYSSAGGSGILLGGVHGTERGKAVVVGGGVSGMAAANELSNLGARVIVVDSNPLVVERINMFPENYQRDLLAVLPEDISYSEELRDTDVLIGAVLVPGSAAPKVVSEASVAGMPDGSVVVDIAIDQSGCIETSVLTDWENPSYIVHGVTHICIPNLPGIVPRTSSQAVSSVILPQAMKIANGTYDEGIIAAISIADGEIRDERIL